MANKANDQSRLKYSSSGPGVSSSNPVTQSAQNRVSMDTDHEEPEDGFNANEMLEQDMYFSIWKEVRASVQPSSSRVQREEILVAKAGVERPKVGESVLLEKYVAAVARAMSENPSASDTTYNDEAEMECISHDAAFDGLGPADCDGVHLSSCGHAVHQQCLDRYLSSLKERYVRRISFEGGCIVNPDQGEFLCPVCRRLANSVLPSLPGDFKKGWMQPLISTVGDSQTEKGLSLLSEVDKFMWFRKGLSLLQSASSMIEKGDILKTYHLWKNKQMKPDLDSISRLLIKIYFPNSQDKFSVFPRVNHSMIMWDTLKYTLASIEITARGGRTRLEPTYSINTLYQELKSATGFVLSLLLKIAQCLRSKNSVHVLQRFQGIQLFAYSICSGVCMNLGCGDLQRAMKHMDKEVSYPDTQFWKRAADPVLAHDAFSSLMWVLFCLPHPFLSCEESFLSLVQVFYVVTIAQATITCCCKHHYITGESDFQDSLITDISKYFGESGWIQKYFDSSYVHPSSDIRETIHKLTFPYLRRCALLWRLLSTSISAPFCDRDSVLSCVDGIDAETIELVEVQELEKTFKIPPLNFVLKDQALRSLVKRWLRHFQTDSEVHSSQSTLHITPAFPFRLMSLPHLYQDLLHRFMKQHCVDCKNVIDEPALCLLCGKLCSTNRKLCCRENGCQSHAAACGAGTGVFLLIRRTTILLQRCARQAHWPSLYLDAFGEEDIEMHRGKPLYLNNERYASLTYMVASHGFDRNSEVLGQTIIGFFI